MSTRCLAVLLFLFCLPSLLAGCGGGGGGGAVGGTAAGGSATASDTASTRSTVSLPDPTPTPGATPQATPAPLPSPQVSPAPTPIPPPLASGRLIAAQGFATTPSPADVTSADVNGDGRPDLLTGGSGGLTVLLNATTPALAQPVSSAAFSAPQLLASAEPLVCVRAGHLRAASARPDVVTCSNGHVTVFANDTPQGATAAGLTAAADVALTAGASQLCLADLNGDGLDDIVVADATDGRITVLLNQGNLTFAVSTVDVAGTPSSVAAADLDGDGVPDLAVTTPSSVVLIPNATPRGAGAPVLGPTTALALPLPGRWIALGDLDGDGRPDVAAVTTSDNVSVFLNRSGGGALAFGPVRDVDARNAKAVALADMNGDGRPDLVVDDGGPVDARSGGLSYYPNATVSGSAQAAFGPPVHAAGSFQTAGITVADLDGDGHPDGAVVSTQIGTAVVFLATGGGFRSAPQLSVPAGPWGIALADVNGDGRLDIVLSSAASDSVSVLLGGTGAWAVTTFPCGGRQPRGIAVADVDGDGRADIVVSNAGSDTVTVLRNTTPTGASPPSFAPAVSAPVGSAPLAVAVADVDGDGIADIVSADGGSASVSVVRGASSPGAVTLGATTRLALDANPTALQVADLDGDGRPDVAATVDIGRVEVLRNTSSAGAVAFDALYWIAVIGGPTGLGVGDLDGDGHLDLVESAHGGLTVLLNTSTPGALSFVPTNIGIAVSQADSVVVADLRNAGRPDIVLGAAFGETMVLRNRSGVGAPAFDDPLLFETGNSTRAAIAVGDVDGDRIPDVVTPNFVEGTIGIARGY